MLDAWGCGELQSSRAPGWHAEFLISAGSAANDVPESSTASTHSDSTQYVGRFLMILYYIGITHIKSMLISLRSPRSR